MSMGSLELSMTLGCNASHWRVFLPQQSFLIMLLGGGPCQSCKLQGFPEPCELLTAYFLRLKEHL